MQQTDKYKLNLIEKDDVFSPDALNENMEKVEAQFASIRAESADADAAETAARAESDAALDQRLAALEVRRIEAGYASGEGTVELGFTPIAVLTASFHGHAFVTQEHSVSGLQIVEGGFKYAGNSANCRYIAFL